MKSQSEHRENELKKRERQKVVQKILIYETKKRVKYMENIHTQKRLMEYECFF